MNGAERGVTAGAGREAGGPGCPAPRPAAGRATDVVLVSMPFDSPFAPSIGLSLLKAGLGPLGVPVKVLYFTVRFAERVGTDVYARIQHSTPLLRDLVGEWIFADALFGPGCLDAAAYVEGVLRRRWPVHHDAPLPESLIDELLGVRATVEAFLGECVDEVIGHRPRIVGFTSVFQQHVASLALAKRVKTRSPGTFVVFGGANCEGVMGAEAVRRFPFVDAVVSGEGDLVFPELVRRVREDRHVSDLQGVYTADNVERRATEGKYPNAPLLRDMDAAPVPDYDDFFAQLDASRLDRRHGVRIMFETSRGCWWGERSHCTFCGLNDAIMPYRGKSARRAIEELVHLTGRYPGCAVVGVDWILDMRYFKDFIPELAARRLDVELFYEVKANLKKEHVRMLRDAGVRVIKPGIESFSSRVLELMKKGVRGLQNIQLLKWCRELGVHPQWNMLWGFPGEPPDEYHRMAGLIPLLTHLPPPQVASAIRIDRFSPNFEAAEALGFADVRPYPAYRHIYPFEPSIVANLAYYFDYGYREPRDVEAYTAGVVREVARWQAVHEQSELFAIDLGTLLLVCDLRPATGERLTVLSGLERLLYLACDGVSSLSALQQVTERAGSPLPTPALEAALEPLVQQGLLVREGSSYLGLAIPTGEYAPGPSALARLRDLIRGSRVALPEESLGAYS